VDRLHEERAAEQLEHPAREFRWVGDLVFAIVGSLNGDHWRRCAAELKGAQEAIRRAKVGTASLAWEFVRVITLA
jgi:hypothetical protein